MDDLPQDQNANDQQAASSSLNKERAEPSGGLEAPSLREMGKEAPLPSEVLSAGVRARGTSVTLPQSVAQLGVKPVGDTTEAPAAAVLPLTDDQIATGLHQSLASSWRWLSEWCIRKLKQLHMTLKKMHGKFVRVKTG